MKCSMEECNLSEPWEWQWDEDFLQKDSNLGDFEDILKKISYVEVVNLFQIDASDYLWDEINQNEEDFSYMLDEGLWGFCLPYY
uniref:Uncharacterized protein n=1 Tax=Nelumbo nucifera TaxID=4432 RepID=A0A822ZMD6_NELNU|nr:TPA_asm: hypothetical protein HUJ06_004297 [Nelumbo nucifera]